MSTLRQAAQQALEAWFRPNGINYVDFKPYMEALRAALAEPEQEAIGTVKELFTLAAQEKFDLRGSTKIYLAPTPQPEQEPVALETVYETIIDWDENGGKRSRRELARRIVALYTAPTPRKPEHITDGSPCWCNPDVIEEEGGSVIVHNYNDNWQQYAKPGETAQQCIERHRAEQDALMTLYATPRNEPVIDKTMAKRIATQLGWEPPKKPLTDEEVDQLLERHAGGAVWSEAEYRSAYALARAIERAHGIGEQHE